MKTSKTRAVKATKGSKTRAARKSRHTQAGAKIIAGLTEALDGLRAGGPLEEQFTVRRVEIPAPDFYDAPAVRATRAKVNASQGVFAQMLGVSAVLVRKWEQGQLSPAPWARRLLDEMNREPSRWSGMARGRPTSASA